MILTKKILIDELLEDSHPQPVEEVIFFALAEYAKNNKQNWNGTIAFAVSKRIEDAKNEKEPTIMNEEYINEFLEV